MTNGHAAREFVRSKGWTYDCRRGFWVKARRRVRKGVSDAGR